MKKKILFISPGPFGSFTDTLFYYKYLKNNYDLNYIGFDEDKSDFDYEGIKINHIRGFGNKLRNKIIFFFKIKALIKSKKFDLIFINYFLGSSILKLFLKNHVNVIDIRSGNISTNKFKRFIYNLFLNLECQLFKNITVISKSLKESLKLPKRSHILPLGAQKNCLRENNNKGTTFLYIGTFWNRNITVTIKAFKIFLDTLNLEQVKNIRYNIIGFGNINDENKIKKLIEELSLSKNVFFLGEIRYPKILDYLKKSDIGVGYIPILKQFQNQPPTKIFEYILSGIAVIATNTNENKLVINKSNGILVDDDIESFANGLIKIYERRDFFSPINIQKNSLKYSWKKIVNENMIPFIEKKNDKNKLITQYIN